MMRVLITGGAGYVGSVLTPYLTARGYQVVIYDTMWFGQPQPGAHIASICADIRDTAQFAEVCKIYDIEAVIHLAAIANDPSFELNPTLSREVNFKCFEPLVNAAKDAGVKRFIYASSSSVYGVSQMDNVTEEHPLLPITDYNKYKGLCEPLLLKHEHPEFTTCVVRPATICGYSPRQRLDLVVNIFTSQAIVDGKIKVFGGEQQRPNLHLTDMCTLYTMLLRAPAAKVGGEIFNAGAQNLRVIEIANLVRRIVPQEVPDRMQGVELEITRDVIDNRSYVVSSDKLRRVLNWQPRFTITDAVRDLCDAFRFGMLPADALSHDRYFNVRQMKAIGLA